jgi:uncharacterized protein (TIGR00266 family)
MQIELTHKPGCAVAKITLQPGESVTTEGGGMIAMNTNLSVKTSMHKKENQGFFSAVKRMLAGESLFFNHYTAGSAPGTVYVAPDMLGDVMQHELHGNAILVQSGSYVASTGDVSIEMNMQGFKSLFSGEGLFWLKLKGTGTVLLNSFGAIYPVQVNGEYIVDTGHIVAFDESLNFTITKVGSSLFSSFLGGEGLVCKFKGQGTVWCQSHNPNNFGAYIGSKLKPRK